MNEIYPFYIAAWVAACVVAVFLHMRDPSRDAPSRRTYFRFIFAPWKAVVFVAAASGLTAIAPYTGDPTWDYFDALVMSILTYFTAPWAVGVVYRWARGRASFRSAYPALCVWMFTVSWFYDAYILLKDGAYPPTWWSNIFASSTLYALAGLLWNLHGSPERGATLAFMEEQWPPEDAGSGFRGVACFVIVIVVIVVLLMAPFVFEGAPDLLSWYEKW